MAANSRFSVDSYRVVKKLRIHCRGSNNSKVYICIEHSKSGQRILMQAATLHRVHEES